MYKRIITYIISVIFSICSVNPCVFAKGTEVLIANDFETFCEHTAYLTDNLSESEISIMSEPENSRFSLKRLIVHTDSDIDYLGAKYAINGYNNLIVLQYETTEETETAYQSFKENPKIEYVEPDILVSTVDNLTCEALSTETLSWGYGINYIDVASFRNTYLSDTTLPEITVAVIDTGIDSDHSMFSDRLKNGKNLITSSSYPEDDNGHGTHVSGIVCDGTLDNVYIMPVKSMNASGAGSTLTVSNGITYAINNGADIINMSIGGLGSFDDNSLWTKRIREAIANGCTVITAAGNFKMNISSCIPANVPESISVASTGKNNSLATNFSNYGEDVDISAPGVSIVSANSNGATITRSGTSMSAPHVSACVANLLSYDNSLKPSEIETLLKYNSKPVSAKRNYPFGYGIVNLNNFSFDAITLNKTEVSTVKGREISLSANTYPSSAVTFKTSDDSVASVGQDGIVTANCAGTAEISATANGVTAKCSVTVNEIGEWYEENETELYIDTADELLDVSELTNSGIEDFSGKTITLLSNIDMNETEFIPIGTDENKFNGKFIGNEYTVSNLYDTTYLSCQGLFGVTGDDAIIKDLSLLNVKIESEASAAALVGKNYGQILNCKVSGTVLAKNALSVLAGGVCAINFGEIINCKNSVSVSVQGAVTSAAGGICAKNCGSILNCINKGTVSGIEYRNTSGNSLSGSMLCTGGIAGQNGIDNISGSIINSINLSETENNAASATDGYTGTICANLINGEIKNCYFNTSAQNAVGKSAQNTTLKNLSEFYETELLTDITIGNYTGNDLLRILNMYVLEYNAENSKSLIYLWKEDNSDFNLFPSVFYIDNNDVISGNIYDMNGTIAVASYNSDDVCIHAELLNSADYLNTVTAQDDAAYIKVFWWDFSAMKPRFISLNHSY